MVKKKAQKKAPLTLHGLLGALSYWGTSARLLLAGFVSFAVFVIALSETTGATGISNEVILLIYILASILALDLGYVVVARALPLRRTFDIMGLIVADLGLLGLYVMPKLVVTATLLVNPVGIAVLIAILVLALRLLTGLLFSTKRL